MVVNTFAFLARRTATSLHDIVLSGERPNADGYAPLICIGRYARLLVGLGNAYRTGSGRPKPLAHTSLFSVVVPGTVGSGGDGRGPPPAVQEMALSQWSRNLLGSSREMHGRRTALLCAVRLRNGPVRGGSNREDKHATWVTHACV